MMAASPEPVDPRGSPARRIAFVITRSDAIGGAQVHVYELAKALAAAGHAVAVFVGGDGPFCALLRAAGIPVWPIPDLVREVRPWQDLRALGQLETALRAFNPDLVSSHSTKAGWWGRVIARRLGVPSVGTAHGWLLTPGRLEPWQQVARISEWAAGRLSERTIVVSQYDRAIALEHGVTSPDKLAVVYNSLPDIEPALLADPGRNPPRLVMVARLQWPKDPLSLIAALEQHRDRPWTLELIGDGPDRARVQEAIAHHRLEDRVELSGTCDDVPARLACAQIFVLSSLREGFPISVLEAMRAGLPVVASDVGGIAEAVEAGKTGAIAPPQQPAALADALAPLLADPQLRREQGAAGRARFLAAFSFEHHLRAVWGVYSDAMRGHRHPTR